MKKLLLTNLMAGLFLATGVMGMTAQGLLPQPGVSPTNNQIANYFNNSISLTWNVPLVGAPEIKEENEVYIPESLDGFIMTLDGVTKNPSDLTFRMLYNFEGNENSGQTVDIYTLMIELPMDDPFDAYFMWKGRLNVTVPEGFVKSTSGALSPEVNLTYYALDIVDGDWTWNYEKNQSFKSSDCKLVATLPYSDTITINENPARPVNYAFVQRNGGGQIGVVEYMSLEGDQLTFDFAGFPAGTYTLTVPEGVVFIGDTGFNWEQQPPTFIIEENPDPQLPPVSANPASGIQVDQLNEVLVNWFYASLNINENNQTPISVTYNGQPFAGNFKTGFKFNDEITIQGCDGNILYVDFTGLDLEGGEYVITIPAGYVVVSDLDGNGELPNEEVVLKYTLVVPEPILLTEYTVNPAAGEVESLNKVVFTWSGARLLNENYKNTEAVAVTCDGKAYSDFKVSVATNTLTVTFDKEVTTEGKYVITIPDGYLVGENSDGDNVITGPATVTYTLAGDDSGDTPSGPVTSGVESILEEGGNNAVYNLQGVRVNSENLPAGIYIINGHKVVLK